MQSSPQFPARPQWWSWILVALVAIVVLAPWWRNHTHLRSFFDYGLVIGGAGRIEAGERPYVDFITPAQAGWYGLNWLSEKAAGGTFQGMTAGGAASIVISFAVLMGMLARRWPLPAAALVAGTLVCATVSQHTLWWYNPWGVVLLTVVAWAGAVAPVLRREHLGWHVLAAAALFFGGVNKINMQLMAAGLALAWAVRAGLTGAASWRRVLWTAVFYAACLVLPVLAEMAWTGASFAAWWNNVITMPAASRSGMALQAFAPKYLLEPFNDHYADVVLAQGGLVGLVLTLLTLATILRRTWRGGGRWEKFLPVACAVAAYVGGVVLLATNMDIIYIGLGGWIGLLVALWLGYGLPARGPWFQGVMIVPAVLVGAISWESAWRGQRSQFGHSGSPRSSYVDAAEAGDDFEYFRGTLMPPETVASLREMGEWRRSLSAERQAGHFLGPGTEWAAHIWPAIKTPGLPISLYRQPGNSDSKVVLHRVSAALREGTFREITVARVVDFWENLHVPLLEHRYDKHPVGEIFARYSAHAMYGVSGAPVWFTRAFGGNADSRQVVSDAWFVQTEAWHQFLGVTEQRGTMQLKMPSNRLRGEVVVRRVPEAASSAAASADFSIYAQANATTRFERWNQRVELPAGQEEIRVQYAIDSSGMPATFTVEIPEQDAGKIVAGWRGPQILHATSDGPDQPDWFFRSEAKVTVLDEAALAKLLPDAWRPDQAFMRNGRVTEQGIELSSGGEIWLKVHDFVTEFVGRAEAAGQWDPSYVPFVRAMWYRGGRLEVYSQMLVRESDRAGEFNAWCSEPGGWLIIAVDPLLKSSSVRLRVHKVTQK
jgi:hypothetical protein